jgi:exopolyphosphatase/guanosine-5'-triphosphate,3'-diphosphate pyrophosphatase
MYKLAAIDMGTNSFHMVIANVNNKGVLNIIAREKESVRLGSSSGDMKFIQPEAIKRAIQCLSRFAEIAKSENAEIRAVATSAVREAINKEEFISKVEQKTGITVEVVSGKEEARLINEGVIHSLNLVNKKALVIDIGGGSTETIVSESGTNLYLNSAKLGAIRLTKKFFDEDEIKEENIAKAIRYIQGEWVNILDKIKEIGFDLSIGTSGTIENLIRMAYIARYNTEPSKLNGLTVTSKQILKLINQIKLCKTITQIRALPGLDTSRADILLAGALILEYFIIYLKVDKITLSSYALREGIVYDTYQKSVNLSRYHHLTDLRYKTTVSLAEKYEQDIDHIEHVARISSKLFQSLSKFHFLGDKELELLEVACYLHDIGFFISHDSHHKHSYYLIKNSEMPGFTNDEQEIIANIARYHRKSHPKRSHEEYTILTPFWQNAVWYLASILRIAEGIDRRQIQSVEDIEITITESLEIRLIAKVEANIDIEIWGANRRKDMLEEKLGLKVRIY